MESKNIYEDSTANKVQLFISCRKLKDLDIISKTDPQVFVYVKEANQKAYTLIGKSEIISNSLNPDFTKSFIVNYHFEREQFLRFEVFDIDNFKKNELVGNFETTLAKIMSAE